MEDFIVGALEIGAARWRDRRDHSRPGDAASARWGYVKSLPQDRRIRPCDRRRADRSRSAATARVVIGAIEAAPIVIADAAELFGGRIAGDYKQRFDARVADALLAKAGVANAADRHIHVERAQPRGPRGRRMSMIALTVNRRAVQAVVGAAHQSRGFRARQARPDRHASRLRTRRLRRMHGAARWRAGALVHHLCGGLRRG